ncbi:NACHT domain-containing protein [Candidatus Woesearchaeota archaeon]|nr:NACHT domain-containing protein [Candidatus Woesearchaeota archaeon]
MFIRIFSPENGKLVLKDAVINAINQYPQSSAKKIFYCIKQQGISITYHGVYKAIRELVNDRFLLEANKEYALNTVMIEQRIAQQKPLVLQSLSKERPILETKDYVLLDIIPTYLSEFQYRQYVEGTKNPYDILKQFPIFLLIGDSGSGKTTLLKLLAAQEKERIPLFLPLQHYHKDDFFVFIKQCLRTPVSKETIEYHFEQGSFLLLFDGLDENPEYEKTLSELYAFTKHYPKNKMVITTRTSHDPKEMLPLPTFALAPMNQKQVQTFLQSKNKEEAWSSLPHAIKELCKTPLHIMMALHIKKKFPENAKKVDVYDAFITESLVLHEKKNKNYYSADLKKVLAQIAFKTEMTFSHSSLLEQVSAIAKEEQWEKKYEQELIVALLKIEILQELENGAYTFSHQRIRDYFIALYMSIHPFDTTMLFKRKSVLPFYAGLVDNPKELIYAIFTEYVRTVNHEYLFLATKCLKEVKTPEWNDYQGILHALLNIYNYTDALFYPHWYSLREIFYEWNDPYVIQTLLDFFGQCEEDITPRLVNILYHTTIALDDKRMQTLRSALIATSNKHLQYSIIEIVGLQNDISMVLELKKFLTNDDPILVCQTARTLERLQSINQEQVKRIQQKQQQKLLTLIEHAQQDFMKGHALIELAHIDTKQAFPYIEIALQDKKPIIRYHASYIIPRLTEEQGTKLLHNLVGAETILMEVKENDNSISDGSRGYHCE